MLRYCGSVEIHSTILHFRSLNESCDMCHWVFLPIIVCVLCHCWFTRCGSEHCVHPSTIFWSNSKFVLTLAHVEKHF